MSTVESYFANYVSCLPLVLGYSGVDDTNNLGVKRPVLLARRSEGAVMFNDIPTVDVACMSRIRRYCTTNFDLKYDTDRVLEELSL